MVKLLEGTHPHHESTAYRINASGATELGEQIRHRYVDAPGVIPMGSTGSIGRRIFRMVVDRVPLLADIQRRWLPTLDSRPEFSRSNFIHIMPSSHGNLASRSVSSQQPTLPHEARVNPATIVSSTLPIRPLTDVPRQPRMGMRMATAASTSIAQQSNPQDAAIPQHADGAAEVSGRHMGESASKPLPTANQNTKDHAGSEATVHTPPHAGAVERAFLPRKSDPPTEAEEPAPAARLRTDHAMLPAQPSIMADTLGTEIVERYLHGTRQPKIQLSDEVDRTPIVRLAVAHRAPVVRTSAGESDQMARSLPSDKLAGHLSTYPELHVERAIAQQEQTERLLASGNLSRIQPATDTGKLETGGFDTGGFDTGIADQNVLPTQPTRKGSPAAQPVTDRDALIAGATQAQRDSSDINEIQGVEVEAQAYHEPKAQTVQTIEAQGQPSIERTAYKEMPLAPSGAELGEFAVKSTPHHVDRATVHEIQGATPDHRAQREPGQQAMLPAETADPFTVERTTDREELPLARPAAVTKEVGTETVQGPPVTATAHEIQPARPEVQVQPESGQQAIQRTEPVAARSTAPVTEEELPLAQLSTDTGALGAEIIQRHLDGVPIDEIQATAEGKTAQRGVSSQTGQAVEGALQLPAEHTAVQAGLPLVQPTKIERSAFVSSTGSTSKGQLRAQRRQSQGAPTAIRIAQSAPMTPGARSNIGARVYPSTATTSSTSEGPLLQHQQSDQLEVASHRRPGTETRLTARPSTVQPRSTGAVVAAKDSGERRATGAQEMDSVSSASPDTLPIGLPDTLPEERSHALDHQTSQILSGADTTWRGGEALSARVPSVNAATAMPLARTMLASDKVSTHESRVVQRLQHSGNSRMNGPHFVPGPSDSMVFVQTMAERGAQSNDSVDRAPTDTELPAMTTEETTPEVDLEALADQIYEILVRRLATERERRGL